MRNKRDYINEIKKPVGSMSVENEVFLKEMLDENTVETLREFLKTE